jgi:DNA mismatch repair protein MutH
MKAKTRRVLWIVVKVEAGIPVSAKAFGSGAAAARHEMALRAEMRPECDETGVFMSAVPRMSSQPIGK